MKKRLLIAIVLLITLAVSVYASTYTCQNTTDCVHSASCDGTYYSSSGCKIQCYTGGTGGQISPAGSADCSGGATGPGVKDKKES